MKQIQRKAERGRQFLLRQANINGFYMASILASKYLLYLCSTRLRIPPSHIQHELGLIRTVAAMGATEVTPEVFGFPVAAAARHHLCWCRCPSINAALELKRWTTVILFLSLTLFQIIDAVYTPN